jgi:hypothetical protein
MGMIEGQVCDTFKKGGAIYGVLGFLSLLKTRMTKLPNKKAGDNIGKNLRGKPHVVTPTLQG